MTTIILQHISSWEHHVNLLTMQSYSLFWFVDRWLSHFLIENYKKDILCPDIVHRPSSTATNTPIWDEILQKPNFTLDKIKMIKNFSNGKLVLEYMFIDMDTEDRERHFSRRDKKIEVKRTRSNAGSPTSS